MKKIVLLLIVSISTVSCSFWYDDDIYHRFSEEPTTLFEINIGSSGDGIAEINIGTFAEDESAAFKLQAQHYRISELNRNQNTGEIFYRYQPPRGYTGEDYVEILAPTDRNGNQIIESNTLEFLIKVSN